jgi:hypothetical protein
MPSLKSAISRIGGLEILAGRVMKKLRLDGLISAVLKKIGVPTSATIATHTVDDTSAPDAVNNPDDLPPELADYPGVRRLFEQAQKQGAESGTDRAVLPPEAPADGQSPERPRAQPIHDVSELASGLASGPEIRKLVEDAKAPAVVFSTERVISPPEIAKDPRLQEPPKEIKINPSSTVGPRVDLPPGAIHEGTIQKPPKASRIGRVSEAFDWIVLIVLCVGLAFAVAALIVLFKTAPAPP